MGGWVEGWVNWLNEWLQPLLLILCWPTFRYSLLIPVNVICASSQPRLRLMLNVFLYPFTPLYTNGVNPSFKNTFSTTAMSVSEISIELTAVQSLTSRRNASKSYFAWKKKKREFFRLELFTLFTSWIDGCSLPNYPPDWRLALRTRRWRLRRESNKIATTAFSNLFFSRNVVDWQKRGRSWNWYWRGLMMKRSSFKNVPKHGSYIEKKVVMVLLSINSFQNVWRKEWRWRMRYDWKND